MGWVGNDCETFDEHGWTQVSLNSYGKEHPEARPFFPPGWLRGKGWPSFERAVSGLVKRTSESSWRRIVDPTVARGMYSGHRDAPLHPRAFAAELARKIFTNGADKD